MPELAFTLVKMHNFKGGLHLSRGRRNSYSESQNLLHSDTLKSALFYCALQLFGEEKINESFLRGFRISSAFPFTRQDEKELYFFPKPNAHLKIEIKNVKGSDIKSKHKMLKKLAYLDKALFEKVISNEPVTLLDQQQIHKNFAGMEMMCEPKIFENETYQHVEVPRIGSVDSTTYYVDKRYFKPESGLFFLMVADNEIIREQVFSALKLLADSGLGTDRNNGNGFFEFSGKVGNDVIDNFRLKVPDDPTHEINLSLYLPVDKEELGDMSNSQYELVKRGGYLASPENSNHLTLRKRSVYMFLEGSVFHENKSRKGNIANLQPNIKDLENVNIEKVDHPVYRDGQALFLPYKSTDL